MNLQWRGGSHPQRPRRPLPHELRPDAGPRQAARVLRRRDAGGRPRRAQGAAAHGRRRRRRRARPAPRASRTPTSTSARARSRRSRRCVDGRGREPRRLRRRAHPAPGAQPREGARRAGDRPHRGDPRHLRRARPLRRGQAPGRARPARVQPRPHARPVDAPRAPRRRRGVGGIGTRGPGESQIETDRRLARDRIAALRRRLARRRLHPRR